MIVRATGVSHGKYDGQSDITAISMMRGMKGSDNDDEKDGW